MRAPNCYPAEELDVFCARDRLICHAMGFVLHKEQYLLDQRVIMCVSRLQQVWLTLHLHATHIVLVIGVDGFTVFVNLSNQMRLLGFLPVAINVRSATLEHTMRCVCPWRNHDTLVYTWVDVALCIVAIISKLNQERELVSS